MIKRGYVLTFVLLIACVFIFSTIVFADNSTSNSTGNTSSTTTTGTTSVSSSVTGDIGTSYQCLTSLVNNKTSLSLQEAVFSTLALGSQKKIVDVIEAEKGNNCWPKESCKIKDSAQVILAYDKIGKDTSAAESWLVGRNATPSELSWYLEIDIQNHIPSTCKISYDTNERTIQIGNDMKITGDPGSCLSISSSGYWLGIRSQCLSKTFSVSCDQDFITTLLYQKASGGSTIFVSSNTHSAASLGTTQEAVNALCFKLSGSSGCDYEGSLWATLALEATGHDVSSYVPYLVALADDNQKYFPSAFLYKISGGDDQFSNVIQSQQNNQYWSMQLSPYNRYYDSALGMMAIYGSATDSLTNAQNYFLSIRAKNGCWNSNNIRDTAFLLFAGWPQQINQDHGGTTTNNGTVTPTLLCSSNPSYSCTGINECLSSSGTVQYQYQCTGLQYCCSVNVLQQSCAAKSGRTCASNQQCDGQVATSSDGECCLGSCVNTPAQQNVCAQNGGTCESSSSCSTGETQITDSCADPGLICCQTSTEPTPSTSSNAWIWILILGILIILAIIGYLMRNKIRLMWFKSRGNVKSTPVNRPGPPGAGTSMPPMGRPRPIFRPPMGRPAPMQRVIPQKPVTPPPQRKPVSTSPSPKDKEIEETLKKLKDMTK